MKQTAQVIRSLAPGYVEVKVRRQSACASAHNCGSCGACGLMADAPEVVVVAQDTHGAKVGDTVIVESATSKVLGAAVLLYIVPFLLFFAGYLIGNSLSWSEGPAIALGGAGFAGGILGAVGLDRYLKNHRPMRYKVVSIGG